MAHGQPDFGLYAAKATVSGLADIGELAARLGSIATFDRRGDIVWFDDFEGDVDKWYQDLEGTDAAIVVSPDAARNGSFSAKLTTGDEIDDFAMVLHYLPYPVTSRVGFEISFTTEDNLSELIFSQRLYDGDYEHYARLRYLPATDVLQYLDSGAVWRDLATSLDLYDATYIFHTIKLVIDLDTHKYIRAILDDVEYDMSALNYRHTADPDTTPHWEQIADMITGVNDNVSNYVDDAVVTQNEP